MRRDPEQYEPFYQMFVFSLPPDIQDDVKQEMRIAVWQGRNARYAAVDFLRKWTHMDRRTKERPFYDSLEELLPSRAPTVDGIDQRAREIDAEALIARLAPRDFFLLCGYASGYRVRELAAWLGLPEPSCTQFMHQARKRLQLEGVNHELQSNHQVRR
jgi:DNA-directed RNA polymerase specialized sigma24 family protein